MTFRFSSLASVVLIGALVHFGPAAAQDRSIVVASTTSTQDSGLFGYLLPIFKAKTGIEVKVIAQGTGQALDTARSAAMRMVFVQCPIAGRRGFSPRDLAWYYDVMYNDFVLIRAEGRSGRRPGKDIETALKTIQAKAAPFVSRGDRSGTHAAELALRKQAGIDKSAAKGHWYREIGPGHGRHAQYRHRRDERLCAVDRGMDLLQG